MEREPLTEEEFRRLWATAKTLADLGRQAGISRKFAYELAKKYGLPSRPRGVKKPLKVDVPLLFRLWAKGEQVRLIAEALGVRECQVGRLARRYKLPPRGLGKGVDISRRADDPTPEEIAERAAECRAKREANADAKGPYMPAYHYDERTGIFTGITSWVA